MVRWLLQCPATNGAAFTCVRLYVTSAVSAVSRLPLAVTKHIITLIILSRPATRVMFRYTACITAAEFQVIVQVTIDISTIR